MIGQPLSVRALNKTYAGAEHPVFNGFSLEIEAGSLCAIQGESGVGKTTLLNCIAGLDHWEGGEIRVGTDRVDPADKTAAALHRRRHIGLAFQQPHLLPEFTVRENLALPLRIEGRAEDDWITHLLDVVGLRDLGARFPNQLSGGQAARAGLARALARKPALWLMDEPTGNLDPATADEVFGFLQRLHDELRPTTLLVTHNPELAARCERRVRLG